MLGRDRVVVHARHRAASWVREEWRLPEAAFQIESVVGELCANALRHGGGIASLDLILCEATAYCPRGLHMVTALTAGWGWHRIGTDQKQVWCEIILPLDPLALDLP
ncbi:hypothetical protein [Streptomyces sp. ME19-01-6]|uniref:hypothetical protein n=1 Tax=Streptomyces sp. ME19-01-6 TaxID=3028686 RepID=UPI0029B51775|nr:hypothetical protein [Streptomyces sp. ME19-01-6]MDX3233450.1 hypothetical protein [Streptomyces sp. ME19-01-6]